MVQDEQNHGPAISLSNLSRRYGDREAVAGVDLEIAGGSFIALVGASGSGKSTMLKMINRLVEPSAGHITIDGINIAEMDVTTLRRNIGYVIQGTGLFPHFTVGANIAIGLRISGQKNNRSRVARLLEMVELPVEYADRMPDTLSGGQRQRVGFARALATAPGLMLMDEPFGALDPVTRDILCTTYRALHDHLGLTTIMVTHDMAEALLMADRIIVIDAGHIVADAPPKILLRDGGGEVADALVAVPRAQAAHIADMLS